MDESIWREMAAPNEFWFNTLKEDFVILVSGDISMVKMGGD